MKFHTGQYISSHCGFQDFNKIPGEYYWHFQGSAINHLTRNKSELLMKLNFAIQTFCELGAIKYDQIHNHLINWFSKIQHFKNHGNACKESPRKESVTGSSLRAFWFGSTLSLIRMTQCILPCCGLDLCAGPFNPLITVALKFLQIVSKCFNNFALKLIRDASIGEEASLRVSLNLGGSLQHPRCHQPLIIWDEETKDPGFSQSTQFIKAGWIRELKCIISIEVFKNHKGHLKLVIISFFNYSSRDRVCLLTEHLKTKKQKWIFTFYVKPDNLLKFSVLLKYLINLVDYKNQLCLIPTSKTCFILSFLSYPSWNFRVCLEAYMSPRVENLAPCAKKYAERVKGISFEVLGIWRNFLNVLVSHLDNNKCLEFTESGIKRFESDLKAGKCKLGLFSEELDRREGLTKGIITVRPLLDKCIHDTDNKLAKKVPENKVTSLKPWITCRFRLCKRSIFLKKILSIVLYFLIEILFLAIVYYIFNQLINSHIFLSTYFLSKSFIGL
ncbi:hypothetical protein VP01_422g4 [Puccinia sorghi]|uniref:Uncharacterized protein n=1 Tax=Puccinia sorghi TaxID=27349 RepID=A0A0L6UQJ4_9BASI|nr:hypothetical protein VP01_422g4 [Puccinia sorghi]